MTTAPTDTASLLTDRDPAHYAGAVPNDDDLTPEQRSALDEVRASCEAVVAAEKAHAAALHARILVVQQHEDALRAIRWRRAARIINGGTDEGIVSESTLRADVDKRIRGNR